jgi:hypothetical protein
LSLEILVIEIFLIVDFLVVLCPEQKFCYRGNFLAQFLGLGLRFRRSNETIRLLDFQDFFSIHILRILRIPHQKLIPPNQNPSLLIETFHKQTPIIKQPIDQIILPLQLRLKVLAPQCLILHFQPQLLPLQPMSILKLFQMIFQLSIVMLSITQPIRVYILHPNLSFMGLLVPYCKIYTLGFNLLV